jgi:hypothetical protein
MHAQAADANAITTATPAAASGTITIAARLLVLAICVICLICVIASSPRGEVGWAAGVIGR